MLETLIQSIITFLTRLATDSLKPIAKTQLTNELKQAGFSHIKAADIVTAYQTNAALKQPLAVDRLARTIVDNAQAFVDAQQPQPTQAEIEAQNLRDRIAQLEKQLADVGVKPEKTEAEKEAEKEKRAETAYNATDKAKVQTVADKLAKDNARLTVTDGLATFTFNHDKAKPKQFVSAFTTDADTGESYTIQAVLQNLNPQKAFNLIVAARLGGDANKKFDAQVFRNARNEVKAMLEVKDETSVDMAKLRQAIAPYVDFVTEEETGRTDFTVKAGVDAKKMMEAVRKVYGAARNTPTPESKAQIFWLKGKKATAKQKLDGQSDLPALSKWSTNLKTAEATVSECEALLAQGVAMNQQGTIGSGGLNLPRAKRDAREALAVIQNVLSRSGNAEPALRDLLVKDGHAFFGASFTVTEGKEQSANVSA